MKCVLDVLLAPQNAAARRVDHVLVPAHQQLKRGFVSLAHKTRDQLRMGHRTGIALAAGAGLPEQGQKVMSRHRNVSNPPL